MCPKGTLCLEPEAPFLRSVSAALRARARPVGDHCFTLLISPQAVALALAAAVAPRRRPRRPPPQPNSNPTLTGTLTLSPTPVSRNPT